jgi:membrane protease YdiL (CAAX protease family)
VNEGNAWVLLLCFLSAAVAAPLAEEFFFRVLLQGWMETVERRWRRFMPYLRRLMPIGMAPILLTSLLFARLHFRVDSPQMNLRFLVFLIGGNAVAQLLTIGFAVAWLRWRVGASAADLGWNRPKLSGDVKLGLAAFAVLAIPIYAMQIALTNLLPAYLAPDPLPLFFLALALGTLYYRTHRIAPVIVLHAALNGTSLLLAWLSTLGIK